MYARPIPQKRPAIKANLQLIRRSDPWILIGDFNSTLKNEERSTEGGASMRFINWIQEKRLIDLGFVGPRFTWNHGKEVGHRRSGIWIWLCVMMTSADCSQRQ